MNALRKYLLVSVCILIMVSCNTNKPSSENTNPVDQEAHFLALGDSISLMAQQALMKQLTTALEKGGPNYAVNFCSERAIPITDSLSQQYNCEIKRVAERNRNPDNALKQEDKNIFDAFGASLIAGSTPQPKLVVTPTEMLYYKPIILGMPACLQCHGGISQLNPFAQNTINARYPEDKAIDFKEGDLRGMWRIVFAKE